MGILVACQSLSKAYSSRPLFRDISFSIDERERIGLIGPNGSGKSTLLKILAGLIEADSGEVVRRKQLRAVYLPQDESFAPDETIEQIVRRAACRAAFTAHEREASIDSTLAAVGFADRRVRAGLLSGGWRKRLSLACALVCRPELLLLDEPTNHLDLEGVLWMEALLRSSGFAYLIVSHDRALLEGVSERIIELNPAYAQGYLSVRGSYSRFLLARQEQMRAQANLEQALASKVRREIAWLSRGARARQTKAQSRIQEASRLMGELADLRERQSLGAPIELGFAASGRKTRELLSAKSIAKSAGGRLLFGNLSFVLSPGVRLGIAGRNGSGKTTLLRLIAGEIEPDAGTIKRAAELRVVYFDQSREELDQSRTLKESLCPGGDTVEYRGRRMHVATWAKKFLFRPDQLNLPISYLSGGEQARIFIARLMLRPADLLILDEPTNDLDIPTLTVLEDSLEEFPGAVVLVTHDRMMLDTVSNRILALDGCGKAEFFADYEQCERLFVPGRMPAEPGPSRAKKGRPEKEAGALSTAETRELAHLPGKIEAAESAIAALELEMAEPEIASDYVRLQDLGLRLEQEKEALERLYSRWAELEAKGG